MEIHNYEVLSPLVRHCARRYSVWINPRIRASKQRVTNDAERIHGITIHTK